MDELKKVKFRDSHGVASIPQTTSETYSSDLQDAQIKDKTLMVYNSKDKAGKKLLEDNLTSKQRQERKRVARGGWLKLCNIFQKKQKQLPRR